MTLTPPQWTLAFAAALATHALAAMLLPVFLSERNNDPPPPRSILVSLTTTPAPARPTPPVARPPEPELAPPTPTAVEPPQPAPVPATVKQVPLTQESVAAINRTPVAKQQVPFEESTATVGDDNRTPEAMAPPSSATPAAAPSVLDAVDLAQLQSQYGKIAHRLLNKRKRYPRRAQHRGDEGTVLVTFVVNRHGEVLSYGLKRSSGNTLLDQEALALIQRAQPLPPFPDDLAKVKDTITMLVSIPFQLR